MMPDFTPGEIVRLAGLLAAGLLLWGYLSLQFRSPIDIPSGPSNLPALALALALVR